jgi:predicted nucleotidyltransferase
MLSYAAAGMNGAKTVIMEECYLLRVGPYVLPRDTRRLIGEYVYSNDDVVNGAVHREIVCAFLMVYTIIMDEVIQTELDKLKELIINAIPVEQIYLFGSYAYGTPHKDSDLDLYVVLKDGLPMRDLDAGLQIALAIARKKSMPVDIIAKNKQDFLNRLNSITLERIVNRDGIRIYG